MAQYVAFSFSRERVSGGVEDGLQKFTLTLCCRHREGITKEHDLLPRRIMEEPLREGLAKGRVITPEMYDEMLDEYYQVRGWDSDGVPKQETLLALSIS